LAPQKALGWQVAEKLRVWEVCCFCLSRHKDGIHRKKDPRSQELKCGVNADFEAVKL
jgi:hypothetical protein